MKQKGAFAVFLTVMFSSLVSAGPVNGVEQLLDGLREIIVVVIQFVGDAIWDINSFDEFLFAKIILFAIILMIVFTVIKENSLFGGKKGRPVQWIISIAVSILSIRYLSDDLVQVILLQYGALAVGLTVFLPLSIYFFFIHKSGVGPFGRRAGWIVFAAAFFALWSFRYDDIGSANWIYWIAIGFIIISIIFDKSIHSYLGFSEIRKSMAASKADNLARALHDLEYFNSKLSEHYPTEKAREKAKERILKRIERYSP